MNKIQGFFTILFFFTVAVSPAQTTKEFTLLFKAKTASEAWIISGQHVVNPPPNAPFTGISAYIDEPYCDAELWYRIQIEGEWRPWVKFRKNEEGPAKGRTAYEGPFIEKEFSAIQFRSSAGSPKEFVFRLYFPGTEKKSADKTLGKRAGHPLASQISCNCLQPNYCGRDCWCPSGNCPKDSAAETTVPTHVIIHHSAGSISSGDFAALVAYYWDLHVNTNGWADIGYNWLIDPNGVVYEGRGNGILGAHFSCMNQQTTGICLIGNFENTTPTFEAVSQLNYFLAWEACDKQIAPAGNSLHQSSQLVLPHISSHRDGNSSPAPHSCASGTLCPGENLYNMLHEIRADLTRNPCLKALSSFDEQTADQISLYPNPATDILHISIPRHTNVEFRSLEILSLTGKKLDSYEGNRISSGNNIDLKISHLSRGSYILKMNSRSFPLYRRFIKN